VDVDLRRLRGGLRADHLHHRRVNLRLLRRAEVAHHHYLAVNSGTTHRGSQLEGANNRGWDWGIREIIRAGPPGEDNPSFDPEGSRPQGHGWIVWGIYRCSLPMRWTPCLHQPMLSRGTHSQCPLREGT